MYVVLKSEDRNLAAHRPHYPELISTYWGGEEESHSCPDKTCLCVALRTGRYGYIPARLFKRRVQHAFLSFHSSLYTGEAEAWGGGLFKML